MKTILIIGMGQFGSMIAKKMSEMRCEVMAVDIAEERVNDVLHYVTDARIGDATNEEFLKSLGVGNFDVCMVALGREFQSSLEVTSLLKELGARRVVSRATNEVQMKFLLRNGADEVVFPEQQMALRIATKYASDSVLDFIQFDKSHAIYELRVPKDWFGKTLSQIDIRKRYNINVLTVKRDNKVFVPSADTVLQADDTAFVLGDVNEIQRYFRI